ncbi:MAG: NADH-quinone oxidoreductase subunit M [Anaerolineae bacterium]|nr:NADH-quinone oxidoreductase subunit M [Anaerolineae bacterium]
MNQMGFPLLTLVVWLPLLGAILVYAFRREQVKAVKVVALAFTALTFVGTLLLWAFFRSGEAGYQFVDRAAWIPQFGVEYALGVDGISLFLVILAALLFVVAVLTSWRLLPAEGMRGYFALLLFMETGVLGVFTALDLVLFYVFWEVMLVPAFFLIGRWGGAKRVRAATKFFIYTMAGSALMLVAILALGYVAYSATGAWTFNVANLAGVRIPWYTQLALFGAFALAFAVKAPVVPFHTWLPDAYVEAPTPVTILLAGILGKMGVYGFIRFAIPLFRDAAVYFGPTIQILAVIGVLYGSLIALVQTDLKRLVAYSSLAHVSLIVLGLFAVNAQSMSGAVFQSVSHGIYIAALFALLGALEARKGTRDIAAFGGVWKAAPVMGFFLLIAVLASVGLPGLNAFAGEFVLLLGVFKAQKALAVLGALGMIFGAWYMLTLFQRVMQGAAKPEALADLTGLEKVTVAPLLLLALVFGVQPNLLYSIIVPAVEAVVKAVAAR